MSAREKIENFHIRCEELINNRERDEAFERITGELNECEDKYLSEYMLPLNFLKYERVLDWIEQNASRMVHITGAWGHLAASSNFT